MNPYSHCALCQHQELSPEGGFMCGITKQRPAFKETCNTMAFDEKLDHQIEYHNAQYEIAKRQRLWAYLRSGSLMTVGVAVSGYGLYGLLDLLEMGYVTPVHFILLAIGVSILIVSMAPFIKSIKFLSETRKNKTELEHVLSRYGITYEIDLFVGKERHGHRHISSEIKIYNSK